MVLVNKDDNNGTTTISASDLWGAVSGSDANNGVKETCQCALPVTTEVWVSPDGPDGPDVRFKLLDGSFLDIVSSELAGALNGCI